MADRHNRDIDRQLAPAPEPLPVPCVDAHAHIEIVANTGFDSPEVRQVIDDAAAAESIALCRLDIPPSNPNGEQT